MATSKKTAAKATKKTAAPKKATPAKKTAPAKPAAKKAAAPKKTAPAKATKKPEAAKKKVVTNSKATSKTSKTVASKKTVNTPVKKAAPKKAAAKAPAKKAAQPATPVKKVAAKPIAKAPAKKAAPPKPAPAPKKAEVKKEVVKPVAKPTAKKTATAKKVVKTITQNATTAPSRPLPATVSRVMREEKKPNVIVAHRKLENKSKKTESEENLKSPNYQPEYKSILDEPIQETGPVYRYSDEELNEFKEIILSRMEAARKELAYLQGLITRKDEAGTEDTENRYMNMEDGSGAMEREQLAQLASRQIQFIGHLEKALMRIENKTYGICRVTGKLIDKARLRAVPHATLSIEAKKEMSK